MRCTEIPPQPEPQPEPEPLVVTMADQLAAECRARGGCTFHPLTPTVRPVAYDRAVLVDVLVHHQRMTMRACGCGWDVLGKSHPEHVADAYETAMKEPH